MTKIIPEHLARGAVVYVQVMHNLESQRRQYGLADQARQLGWQQLEVIDDDLGRSGGGISRPGLCYFSPKVLRESGATGSSSLVSARISCGACESFCQ